MYRTHTLLLALVSGFAWTLALLWMLGGSPVIAAPGLWRPHAATFTVGNGCATIQACIDLAVPGDTVHIPAGEYVESLTLDKPVSLVGAGQETTIIRAIPDNRVMTVTGDIDSSVVISGFTVSGGLTTDYSWHIADYPGRGGGILITGTVYALLEHLTIGGNRAYPAGAGLYVGGDSYPTLRALHIHGNGGADGNCVAGGGAFFEGPMAMESSIIEDNSANWEYNSCYIGFSGTGGGIYAASSLWLTGTTVYSNSTGSTGGGVFVAGDLHATDSRFDQNSAGFAGGGAWVGRNATVQDSHFEANGSCSGSGLYVEQSTHIRKSLFLSNGDPNCATSGGGIYAIGSIEVLDSGFVNNHSGRGGGIYSEYALTLINTDFHSNTATGGGFHHSGGGAVMAVEQITVKGGQFTNNKVEHGGGGAIYARAPLDYCGGSYPPCEGFTEIEDAVFVDNRSNTNGGAISSIVALTLTNSVFERNITDGVDYASGGAVWALNGLRLTGGRFEDNRATGDGGAIFVHRRSVIHGTHFEANYAGNDGGGLYTGADDFQMQDTVFLNNEAEERGGALIAAGYSYGELYHLTDVRFEGNRAKEGGAIVATSNRMTVTNGVFLNNVATESGGGLMFDIFAALIDTRFEGNQALERGGAIYAPWPSGYAPAAHLRVNNSDFVDNKAGANGGGITGITGEVYGSRFFDNEAGEDAGGLYLIYEYRNDVPIHDTEFVGNRAGGSGGALLIGGDSNPYVFNSRFQGNHADENGGAMLLNSGVISQTHFVENSAGGDGGALSITCCSSPTIEQSHFMGNQAQRGGAIANAGSNFRGSRLRATNVLFARNRATDVGAAIASFGGHVTLDYMTIADQELNPAEAIYLSGSCGNFTGCDSIALRNSILANHSVGVHIGELTGPEAHSDVLHGDYLLFSQVTAPTQGTHAAATGSNSFRGDPAFVNPAQDDYTLGAASQARDAADPHDCPAVDIRGAPRPQGLGCDLGAFEGDPMAPTIGVTPAALAYIAMQGMDQPIAQTLHVENIGIGTLNWSAAGTPGWLSANPASGSQSGNIQAQVNHAGLSVGIHQGSLTVSGNATNPQLAIPVMLEVLNACVPLAANGDFSAGNNGAWYAAGNHLIRQGSEMAGLGTPRSGGHAVVLGSQDGDQHELSQEVKLPSGGALTLDYYYQIQSNEESCTYDTVQILLDDTLLHTHGLCPQNNTNGWTRGEIDLTPYGNHAATLRFVQENDPLGSPSVFLLDDVAIVPATTAACDGPVLQVTPGALSFHAEPGGDPPAAQSLQIANGGSGQIIWSASSDSSWLWLSQTEGSGSATVEVAVDATGLNPGVHNGAIVVTAAGAAGTPQTVPVALTVGEAGAEVTFTVAPAELSFTASGGSNPAPQSFTVQLTGGSVEWRATEPLAWLSLTPASGSTTGAVQVRIDAAGLSVGSYSGQIVVTAPGSVPQVVTVNLQVDALVQAQTGNLFVPAVARD